MKTKIFLQSAQLWHIFFLCRALEKIKDQRGACKRQKTTTKNKNNKTKSSNLQKKIQRVQRTQMKKREKTKQNQTKSHEKRWEKNCYKQPAYN